MTTNDDSVDESNDQLNLTTLRQLTMFGFISKTKKFAKTTNQPTPTKQRTDTLSTTDDPLIPEDSPIKGGSDDDLLTDGGDPTTAAADDRDTTERTAADDLEAFADKPVFLCPICEDFDSESKKGIKSHASQKHDESLSDPEISLKMHSCDVTGCTEEFKTPLRLRHHVEDDHVGLVIEKNDDGDYEFIPIAPSEKDGYASYLPPTHPGEEIADSRFAHLKHTWAIWTNADDPLGIEWRYIHLRESLQHTESPLKRGLLTSELVLNYYADLNREVVSRIWTTGKDWLSSTGKTMYNSMKLGILLGFFDTLTTPIRYGLRRLGITQIANAKLPIAINVRRTGWGVAATGALSSTSIGVTISSTLSALGTTIATAGTTVLGGGVAAYFGHDGFRETVNDAGCAVKDAAKTVKNKAKDAWNRFTGWLSSSSKDEKATATAA